MCRACIGSRGGGRALKTVERHRREPFGMPRALVELRCHNVVWALGATLTFVYPCLPCPPAAHDDRVLRPVILILSLLLTLCDFLSILFAIQDQHIAAIPNFLC